MRFREPRPESDLRDSYPIVQLKCFAERHHDDDDVMDDNDDDNRVLICVPLSPPRPAGPRKTADVIKLGMAPSFLGLEMRDWNTKRNQPLLDECQNLFSMEES